MTKFRPGDGRKGCDVNAVQQIGGTMATTFATARRTVDEPRIQRERSGRRVDLRGELPMAAGHLTNKPPCRGNVARDSGRER